MATKDKTTVTLEEIKRNIEELESRAEDLCNPRYELQQMYDPSTHKLVTMSMNRADWWDMWQLQKSWMGTVELNPFFRLGLVRATTDDMAFNHIRKVFEDLLQQIDNLSLFLSLAAKEAARVPEKEEEAVPAVEEEEEIIGVPAAPIKEEAVAPDDAEEESGDDDEEEGGLEVVDE